MAQVPWALPRAFLWACTGNLKILTCNSLRFLVPAFMGNLIVAVFNADARTETLKSLNDY